MKRSWSEEGRLRSLCWPFGGERGLFAEATKKDAPLEVSYKKEKSKQDL